jgi:8-oxo-dGTP pyrophosphatase MutT (NUDIX family)
VSDKPVVGKALGYVLNRGRLLVLRHVEHPYEQTGIQVPGGTIRAGETPARAVLRECREETGLSGLSLIQKLGETRYDISPLRHEIQRRHFFHLAVNGPVSERWRTVEAHDGLLPPTHLECFWIPITWAHALASGHGALISRLPL